LYVVEEIAGYFAVSGKQPNAQHVRKKQQQYQYPEGEKKPGFYFYISEPSHVFTSFILFCNALPPPSTGA
jgi:hypothetical protein